MFSLFSKFLIIFISSRYTSSEKHVFKKFETGFYPHLRTSTCKYKLNESLIEYVPDSIDWRDYQAVTPVKNQEQCGSCWSFSATGAIESAYAIKYNKLVTLSEQQLMDCSFKYGNYACSGGLMDNAFEYATDFGMCSEDEVPYNEKFQKERSECGTCNSIVTLNGCSDVSPQNQTSLKFAVSQQPISVAIEADSNVFQSYRGGIIKKEDCGDNVDHGVLLVGYGTENNIDYWLIKNSWGIAWGEDGYVRIERNDNEMGTGTCGITTSPSYPIVI